MTKMSWDKLFSARRIGWAGADDYPQGTDSLEVFQKDAERILSSSAFRRLQGKTQVYPMPATDFVRNRLTHTYEVAQIGQSVARRIARTVGLEPTPSDCLAQLVFNGCLLHDIGNPPFGHSGESSIQEFFEIEGKHLEVVVNAVKVDAYKHDLLRFDGNAQGFRVATSLTSWKQRGGMRLSAATLSTMVKYPFPSSSEAAAKKKFGFMESERTYAFEVFAECGLADAATSEMFRNPLSVIVEAADDIAYLTSDIQDAYVYRDMAYDKAKDLLEGLTSPNEMKSLGDLDKKHKDYFDNHIGYLRSAAVSRMSRAAAATLPDLIFETRELLPAGQKVDIWKNSDVPSEFKHISRHEEQIRDACAQLIYRGQRKIALQVAGGRIIKFVLAMQIAALHQIFKTLHAKITAKPLDAAIEKNRTTSWESLDVAKYLVENVGEFVSRESAQIFWGMPGNGHDVMTEILVDVLDGNLPSDDPHLAYRVIQISLDFVAGTTDWYLSEYSRKWGGPSISD